jgi:hypothetical protein
LGSCWLLNGIPGAVVCAQVLLDAVLVRIHSSTQCHRYPWALPLRNASEHWTLDTECQQLQLRLWQPCLLRQWCQRLLRHELRHRLRLRQRCLLWLLWRNRCHRVVAAAAGQLVSWSWWRRRLRGRRCWLGATGADWTLPTGVGGASCCGAAAAAVGQPVPTGWLLRGSPRSLVSPFSHSSTYFGLMMRCC